MPLTAATARYRLCSRCAWVENGTTVSAADPAPADGSADSNDSTGVTRLANCEESKTSSSGWSRTVFFGLDENPRHGAAEVLRGERIIQADAHNSRRVAHHRPRPRELA